jgi:transposase-like protein
MITVYRENGKPFYDESAIIILAIKESFDPAKAVCGGCGAEGFLVFYCKYERWLEVFERGAPGHEELALDRYRCGICGKTHVVAPGELVIPYMRHSLWFIATAIEAYAKREKPVRQIAEDFHIVVSTLYAWVGRFHGHFDLLFGKLEAAAGDTGAHIETLKRTSARRLLAFVETYGICFLQAARREAGTPRFFVLRGYLVFCSGGPP